MIMLVFVYMFIFGSIFHIWEKTCIFCVSDPVQLHLVWCPPIASVYFQTPCHYSLWLSNTPLCICTTIHDSFLSCRASGFFQSLAIVNSAAMNIAVQVSQCILSYVLLSRCPGVVSLDHMATLSLVFWGIAILLSIVVVLICIHTSSV
jgi:hypothetical protein